MTAPTIKAIDYDTAEDMIFIIYHDVSNNLVYNTKTSTNFGVLSPEGDMIADDVSLEEGQKLLSLPSRTPVHNPTAELFNALLAQFNTTDGGPETYAMINKVAPLYYGERTWQAIKHFSLSHMGADMYDHMYSEEEAK